MSTPSAPDPIDFTHPLDALKASAMGLLLGAAGVTFLMKVWPSMADLLAMPWDKVEKMKIAKNPEK